MPPSPPTPTKQDLAAAYGKTVPDVIAPNLKVLFVGINPGLYSAAVGHHFARPGNRFWPALHLAGYTDQQLSPSDERQLLARGYGVTNIVPVATARAEQLTRQQLLAGAHRLRQVIRKFRPKAAAIVGIAAYRIAFQSPDASLGRQPQTIGTTQLWVLPNPSGLNAHYQLKELARLFRQLRLSVEDAP